MLEIFVSAL